MRNTWIGALTKVMAFELIIALWVWVFVGGMSGIALAAISAWMINTVVLVGLYKTQAERGDEHCELTLEAFRGNGDWPLWFRVGLFVQFLAAAAILPLIIAHNHRTEPRR